ncbi:FixH family protein [Oceanobacillus longus]|uniref:FixH family protein n=1 Tax=Oceanobacillus longus TaxID=930120 RepID=A0ABV8GVA0_9BACI
MARRFWMLLFIISLGTLVACGGNMDNTSDEDEEELPSLDVEFIVPENADPNEKVELKAIVTYDKQPVNDADEVIFEVWEKGRPDDSSKLDSVNNEDGTYTVETSFDEDGVYELYAHTTARDLHTMPMKSITVGDASLEDYVEEDENKDEEEMSHDH